MPKISEFYGIVIYMYWEDHNPPHFHAYYAGSEVWVMIEPIEVLRGTMPRSQLRMILGWAEVHRQELLDNWRRAHESAPLLPVPPL